MGDAPFLSFVGYSYFNMFAGIQLSMINYPNAYYLSGGHHETHKNQLPPYTPYFPYINSNIPTGIPAAVGL